MVVEPYLESAGDCVELRKRMIAMLIAALQELCRMILMTCIVKVQQFYSSSLAFAHQRLFSTREIIGMISHSSLC
jgi:hypothetical protein